MIQYFIEKTSSEPTAYFSLFSFEYAGSVPDRSWFQGFLLQHNPSTFGTLENRYVYSLAGRSSSFEILTLVAAQVEHSALKQDQRAALKHALLRIGRLEEFETVYGQIHLSRMASYKLDLMMPCLERSHSEFVSLYRNAISSNLRAEFDDVIAPIYCAVESEEHFLDCRTSEKAKAKLRALIVSRLKQREPLGLIRLGDGEAYAWPELCSPTILSTREHIWWGSAMHTELRAQMASEVQSAILSSDILGIPAIYRFIRDYSETVKSYDGNDALKGLKIVLGQSTDPELAPRPLYTEERIHKVAFQPDFLVQLSASADKVVLVSSLKKSVAKQSIKAAAEWIMIEIPTHSKTKQAGEFVQSEETLPDVYRELTKQIALESGPGVLVLVAAGILGKIFIAKARDEGAVALDIGSAVDEWVGLSTRPGLDSYYSTFEA